MDSDERIRNWRLAGATALVVLAMLCFLSPLAAAGGPGGGCDTAMCFAASRCETTGLAGVFPSPPMATIAVAFVTLVPASAAGFVQRAGIDAPPPDGVINVVGSRAPPLFS